MKKFNMYLGKKQIIVLLAILMVALAACDDSTTDPVSGDAAAKYMSKNNTTTFKQEAWRLLIENAKIPISDSTLVLKREQPTITNDLYTYLYKREDNPEIIIRTENLLLESDKIFIEFKRSFSFATQNFVIDLKKIPLLDLSLLAEKKYADTTIKANVDIKEMLESPISVYINFDIKITSQLKPNSTEELTINEKSFKAKSFINTINFTITSNDIKLNLLYPEYNNKLFASGSFIIESWFSETNNLGLIYQSETTLVKDELFSKQTMINTLVQRTAQNYK